MTKTRTLLDGRDVEELDEPITLKVYTKCPEKYMLVDMQTGERYIGYKTQGNNHWRRINEECPT
jgi:hypothetical protein